MGERGRGARETASRGRVSRAGESTAGDDKQTLHAQRAANAEEKADDDRSRCAIENGRRHGESNADERNVVHFCPISETDERRRLVFARHRTRGKRERASARERLGWSRRRARWVEDNG